MASPLLETKLYVPTPRRPLVPQPPMIDVVLATLLNDLNATSRDVVLVIDDHHVIDARDIHDGIGFLLDHLPAQVHVVIAGRADPPLPLARLRARGELAEIRAADLRFTPDETAAFLIEVMGLDLSAADMAALETRTEGWVAGLQLAALSLQGWAHASASVRAFAGDDRYVLDSWWRRCCSAGTNRSAASCCRSCHRPRARTRTRGTT